MVETEKKTTIDKFTSIIDNSLHEVRSEHVFHSKIYKLDLIRELPKTEIITEESQPIENEMHERDEEDATSNDDQEREEGLKPEIEIATVTIMPIAFQIKKFFEMPNVYNKVKTFMEDIENCGTICNFINGTLWKGKLKAYENTDIVIPYHLYFDQAQLNNALGTHCRLGQEMLGYYTFPCIPPEYNSRLENIFVAILHPGHYNKTYGNERCYNDLIDTLNGLAHEGILLNIDGEEKRIYFLLGLLQGDNLEINNITDLVRSFRANYYCRVCKLKRNQMEKAIIEDPEKLRNVENYEHDVLANNSSQTGVVKESIFNQVAGFHVTTSCAMDLTHDIAEGMYHYEISEILLDFIKKGYFKLNTLNKMLTEFKYGDIDKGNAPITIHETRLKAKHLKMTASEMMCFARHLGLMIGDLVPHDDPVWEFYQTAMEFVDLCYLPNYSESDLGRLENVIAIKSQMFTTLFNQTLKPKHHFSTHYPNIIRAYGPLRYLQTIRYLKTIT